VRYLGDPSAPFDEYSYDAAGNVLAFKDGNHDSETPNVEYEYSVLGRLTAVRTMVDASTWAETGYEYDANSNLQAVIDANNLQTEYSIDDFGQTYRIDSPATGTTLLGYDLAGRLVTREDARGMVEQRTYEASGRLTRADLNGAWYGGCDVARYGGCDAATAWPVPDFTGTGAATAFRPRAQRMPSSGKMLRPGPPMQSMPPAWSYAYLGDRLLARFDGAGNVEHVVTDHIGYPMATISYTGTVQWQPDPEPFGDVISEQSVGSGHDPLIRYPGQWRVDPVLATTEPAFTTLYYNTHRWYNPSWGRYTQSDPLGTQVVVPAHFSQMFGQTYSYAMNNPARFLDPMGLTVEPGEFEDYFERFKDCSPTRSTTNEPRTE
jgi:RHS repeat-associated protein